MNDATRQIISLIAVFVGISALVRNHFKKLETRINELEEKINRINTDE